MQSAVNFGRICCVGLLKLGTVLLSVYAEHAHLHTADQEYVSGTATVKGHGEAWLGRVASRTDWLRDRVKVGTGAANFFQ